MGAVFVAASSQYLSLATPTLTAKPFSIGMWVMADSLPGSSVNLWALNGASDNNKGYISASNVVSYYDGSNVVSTTTTMSVGRWYYALWRIISSTNKRVSVLAADGGISHAQITATGTDYSTTFTLGAGASPTFSQGLTGKIAEYLIADADVQPGGVQTEAPLLYTLAYRGPFAVPHIRRDIVEYRNFRSAVTMPGMRDEVYQRENSQAWVNNGGVTVGAHPVLIGGYRSLPRHSGALVLPI